MTGNYPALVSPPPNKPEDLKEWAAREMRRRTPDDSPKSSVILSSPNGYVWGVSVNDDGTMSTVRMG